MPAIRHSLSATLAGAAVLLSVACGSDTITSPIFGAGCTKGVLQPGDTIIGAFTPASCQMDMDWYSYEHAPYESYVVHLTQGKAYHIFLEHVPDSAHGDVDDLDARLTLWTTNADGNSIPISASDDDANHLNSEIWFVAPVGGTFELVAQSYWYGGFGGYRLEMNECPVLGVLDTAGTYNFNLPASPCWRHRAGNNNADTSGYAFVSLNAVAGEGIDASVTSAAFPPAWELFGPGFDTYGKIYDVTQSANAVGSGNSAGFTMDTSLGGQVTIGIGTTTVDSAGGAFTLTLTRTPPAAPPAPTTRWSIAKLFGLARRMPPPKQH